MTKKLLYEEIVDTLKAGIANQKYKVDEQLPTEMELAREFGVSRITSKRALEVLKQEGLIYRVRGSGSFVSPNAVEQPTTRLSRHQADHNFLISMVVPMKDSLESSTAFADGMMLIVRGVSEILNENGFYLAIHSEHSNIQEERAVLNQLYQKKVGGIIYYPISDSENLELLNLLFLEQYPIITIDKIHENIPISYVVSDNMGGAYQATKYLIELGHDKIAFVSKVRLERASSVRHRYFGYCNALKEAGIPVNSQFVKFGFKQNPKPVYEKPAYEDIVRSLVSQQVTGIIAENDMEALFLMRAAKDLQIDVPNDISIIGFDDVAFSKHLPIPLTTVAQDFYQIGKTTARILIESVTSGTHKYTKTTLPTRLVVRHSCSSK